MLIAGALAGVAACGGTAASASKLPWHDCNGPFKCATLSVPVSYSDPHGPQIPISVVELVASGPRPIGDIVFNPGGPGASGVQFLEQAWRTFPSSLREKFTLVSFDPRGVGSSRPLQCLTTAGIVDWISLDPAPTTQQEIKHVVRASKAFVRGCRQHATTAFISSMSTANTARDMDRLRAALGQQWLTYFGLSYGTYLGTAYAEMFPRRIRAMVLDGAVDPALDTEAVEVEQAAGFETDLHDFLRWCGREADCRGRFSTSPAKAYARLIARFKSGLVVPAQVPRALGGRGRVDYGVAVLGVIATLYSKETWPYLGQALAAAAGGDGTYLAGAAYSYAGLNADGSFANILSANMATVCLDRPAPTTIPAYTALASRLTASAPDFGAIEAWSTLPCAYWPARPEADPAPAHAPNAPPILVIGSTGDPATPYTWAKALAEQLPRATLLTRTGSGHTAYRASSCIRTWADRYLETLKMPPTGTVCPSD